MSITKRKPDEQMRLRIPGFAYGLIRGGKRFVIEHHEGTVVAWVLGSFFVLWMLYDSVALAPYDAKWDASEASLWAQNFAFGYKHPPMSAWEFGLWFAVFPRLDWALHLLAVTNLTATLAITWRLLRDHLGKDRALFGLAALLLVPFYTYKTADLDANTVMMPFWAATLLYYLRARHGRGLLDATLAGVFASLTLLGKYWAVYLFAGMAVASFVGAGTRSFWRSPAPYVMAAAAAVVIAPHLYWYVSQSGGSNYAFLRDSVMNTDSLSAAFGKSAYYTLGVIAYTAGPLVLLAALRPSRISLVDIVWPTDADRQQAMILFAVPLLLPALVNMIVPHRLTSEWTFPNWALLPVVLYGSRLIKINATAAATAGLVAITLSLASVVVSPVIAYGRLDAVPNTRPNSREIAEAAVRLADKPLQRFWGSPEVTGGLPFYLAKTRPLDVDPLSAEGRAKIGRTGLLIVCSSNDASCLAKEAALAGAESRTADITVVHTFLGFSGPPTNFRITVIPAIGATKPSPIHSSIGAGNAGIGAIKVGGSTKPTPN